MDYSKYVHACVMCLVGWVLVSCAQVAGFCLAFKAVNCVRKIVTIKLWLSCEEIWLDHSDFNLSRAHLGIRIEIRDIYIYGTYVNLTFEPPIATRMATGLAQFSSGFGGVIAAQM